MGGSVRWRGMAIVDEYCSWAAPNVAADRPVDLNSEATSTTISGTPDGGV